MKRCLILICALVLLSGCTVVQVNNLGYEEMMDKVISLNIKNYNTVGKGYKYYIPKGIRVVDSKDFNDVLRHDDNFYYLYVDVVSYYYKSKLDFKKNEFNYFSREINNGEKHGFINITNKNDKLYIQMNYNYAKIEAYVNEDNLKMALTDMSYILSSVDFNDSLLKKMYEEGNLESKEEVYKLFENKEKEGNFLEYIKEYDKYEEEEKKDTEQEFVIEETTTSKTDSTTKK